MPSTAHMLGGVPRPTLARMSMQVPLAEVAATVAARLAGSGFGYLLSVGHDGRARALALVPEVVAPTGVLVFTLGSAGTLDAVAERPRVSVVFPPVAAVADEASPAGRYAHYSLIVDGDATVDRETGTLTVTPTGAVHHRPAPGR